jgi:Ran GTPase-activating protein (RanGAP) involved in mRNA processing and transport
MHRFFELFDLVNGKVQRRLNLTDMGLGDLSMRIVAEIIKKNKHSLIDLTKNVFTDSGVQTLADAVSSTHTISSLILNANSISADGAVYLFK